MNNEPIKQTQTKPTCSELACLELVEGVEPISNMMTAMRILVDNISQFG